MTLSGRTVSVNDHRSQPRQPDGKRKTLARSGRAAIAAVIVVCGAWGAHAQSLVGSYSVHAGPAWPSQPPTYSCLEACALIFGGQSSDYQCSTSGSSIDNLAWASTYGSPQHCALQNSVTPGTPVAENYKVCTVYNTGGCVSAYVQDHCFQPGSFSDPGSSASINYCWQTVSSPTATPTHTPTSTPTSTPTHTPTSTPTDTPTNTPTRTPTSTPTETPTSTPTRTPTSTPTSTPTLTPTPTATPRTALLKRTYLYLGRANGNRNGKLVLRMIIEDPTQMLPANLLGDAVTVTINDTDSSWFVTRTLTACEARRETRVVCRPSRDLRAVFTRVRGTLDEWKVRVTVRQLTDAETGPTTVPDNPIDPPVSVTLENGVEVSVGEISDCRVRGHFGMACTAP